MAQVLVFLFLALPLWAEFAVTSWDKLHFQDVTKQSFEESCGASALATLLNLDGNSFDEEKLLGELNTTDVVSLYALETLASKLDYQAKSYKIDEKILKDLKYPVIARVARDKVYPHFVVIEVLKEDILMLDPNHGKYLVSMNDFLKIWTKYIMIVAPKGEFKDIKTLNIKDFSYLLDLQ